MAEEHAPKEKYGQLRPNTKRDRNAQYPTAQSPKPPRTTYSNHRTISTTFFPPSMVVSIHPRRSPRNHLGSAARLPNLPPTLRDNGALSRSLDAPFAADISSQPLPSFTTLPVSTHAATVTPSAARRFSHINAQGTPAGAVRIAPAPSSGQGYRFEDRISQ